MGVLYMWNFRLLEVILFFMNLTQATHAWFIFTATAVLCNRMVYIYMSLMLDDDNVHIQVYNVYV
jgi:hypothetical protein